MTASQIGYVRVHAWVKTLLVDTHRTVLATVTCVILYLLVAQRLTSAEMARALPAEVAGSSRSRLRRVHRWWLGPILDAAIVTPRLVRTALAQAPGGRPVRVALDTTRVGGWEIWQAGVVFAGRTLPVAWAVLPYPWPKGGFRATPLALIRRLQAAFPPGQRWVLVADRGFPSAAFFAVLRQGQTDFTVRLRLSDWVTVAGVYAPVRAHLLAGRLRPGQQVPATIGRGTAKQPLVAACIVVSTILPLPPAHKGNPGTRRERAKRALRRQRHLANKGRKSRPPSAAAQRYAQTWVVFTTAASVAEAVAQYADRMAIEQTFRDWHTGWGLRTAATALPRIAAVERMVGIVTLAYRLQVELGWRLSHDPLGQRRRRQWTVTDRVRHFWCGQQLFHDRGYDWSIWLADQWQHLLIPTNNAAPTRFAA